MFIVFFPLLFRVLVFLVLLLLLLCWFWFYKEVLGLAGLYRYQSCFYVLVMALIICSIGM